MKRAAVLLLLFAVVACSQEAPKPLSEPGERLYDLRGEILTRNSDNSLRIRHETIPGYMAAMTMEFPVRGADVKDLPPDGTRVAAKLHVTKKSVWLTDVKSAAN
jgi:hypothetical protein